MFLSHIQSLHPLPPNLPLPFYSTPYMFLPFYSPFFSCQLTLYPSPTFLLLLPLSPIPFGPPSTFPLLTHLLGRPLCTLAEALDLTVSGLVNLRG